ncbi:MAG: response regulator [Deltaproteobacteria bacterium]|nr:response regulator [Deltaproteobacteria bacterium]
METKETKKKKVLLIDDSPETLQLVKEILEDHSFICLTAPTAMKGLEVAKKTRPDLILLDLMLPQMSGFGFVRQLRGNTELSKIPIVVLTAVGDEEVAREVIDMGANSYLRKTCGTRELVSTISNYIA